MESFLSGLETVVKFLPIKKHSMLLLPMYRVRGWAPCGVVQKFGGTSVADPERIREVADHVFGWVAYTIMRSERRNDDASDWRLFDYDQTHILTVASSVKLT